MLFVILACTPPATSDKGAPVDTAPQDTAPQDTSPLDTGSEVPVTEADRVYDPTVLHRVVITMDEADWETLRNQERSIYDMLEGDCLSAPWEGPYTEFAAKVSFDGEDLGTIGLRKKGLMGSASTTRPSLRIDTDEYTEGARFYGLEKLVLNNNNQDESRVRTCLAHGFFGDAGLVAPRCSLATVEVNGEDLGLYDNTESIDEDLIARALGAEPTTLYEGRLSDFREGWLGSFEAKTDASDGADLAAVAAALEADDASVLDALEPVLDTDAFLTFWAAEVIAGHWDGYNGNTNNFYVYGHPSDGRLHFIAAGPDAAFDARESFGSGQPTWVITASALANRLIQIPEARERYEARLSELLADAWDEDARLAELDAYKELLTDDASRSERQAMTALRTIVAARAEDVAEDLGGRVEPATLSGVPCFVDVGAVEVSFSTTFASYPDGALYSEGEAMTSYEIEGVTYTSVQDGVTTGWADDETVLWLTISEIAEDTWIAPYVVFDPALLADGSSVPIDGYSAIAYLLYNSPDTGGEWETAAYLGDGALSFDVASDGRGDVVSGVFTASVLGFGG